jgi:Ca2+/H+ antiporter, TMEM165/GDT1 family
MEFLFALVTAFLLVIPVELPDKTFVATLVLSTRYSSMAVWLGVTVAFGVQCLVAVVAGRLLALLPPLPVRLFAAALFAGRAAVAEREREKEFERRVGYAKRSGMQAAATSFTVLFVAEWGDLSQLLTAGLVAQGRHAVGVFAGSWAALTTISGGAILLGRVLLRYVRLSLIQYVGAAVCAVLAAATLVEAFR